MCFARQYAAANRSFIAGSRGEGGAMNVPGTSRNSVSTAQAEADAISVAGRNVLSRECNARLALIALATLVLGVFVYILDRPAATVYLLPHALSFAGHHRWFGSLGGHLPEFIHVYAFILLTMALGSARVATACAFWWTVDTLFEIGQHPAIAPHIAAWLPGWFHNLPILDNTASYFLHGTFDPGDLVAIALGTIVAYLTIRAKQAKEKSHAHPA